MVTLRHEDGSEETVLNCSLRHYELRHMGYKEVKVRKEKMKNFVLLVQGSGQLAATNSKIFQEMKVRHDNFIKDLVSEGEIAIIQFSHQIDEIFDFSSDHKGILSTFDKTPSAGGSDINLAVNKALEILKDRHGEKIIYVTGGCLFEPSLLESAIRKAKGQNVEIIFLKDFILPSFFEVKFGFPISIL